jgi:glyoxylase I family protein
MDGYGIQLELFIDSRHSKNLEIEPIGFRHLALKVDNIERTIKELGISFSAVGEIMKDWTGISFCFIKDPDDLIIELHE